MPKVKTAFSCQNCGYQSPKWLGRCPDCGSWNSLVEEVLAATASPTGHSPIIPRQEMAPQSISAIQTSEEGRIKTEVSEFDRVLGGGLVIGSIVLIGGDPGIGKSTLLLQTLDRLARKELTVLYVSGEESLRQTKMRAERINVSAKDLFVLAGN